MSTPIWQWSASHTAESIRKRQISAVEVTEAHLARLRSANPALNAVVNDLSNSARVAALAADEKQAKGGPLGLLHGVPITIKENVDFKGEANTGGVAAMRGLIAPSDNPVVANLKAAGAIPIGLTNTPEFSLRLVTDNPLHGLTLNPWNNEITCGGSSGGAGSSLAMGIGALAHGNDIGGSLRWPAHCNGVATIRPTLGRVPAYNESAGGERPMSAQLFSVQGPMARSVADLRLGLEVMSKGNPRDPWWVPAPLKGPPLQGPIKVGVAAITADMDPDPEVVTMVRKAADYLAAEGYIVEEIEVPELTQGWRNWLNLLIGEIEVLQAEAARKVTSDDFNTVLDGYLQHAETLDLKGYMLALSERTRHLRNWMMLLETYPIILTPVSVQKAFGVREDTLEAGRTMNMFENAMRYVGAVNHVGLPAAVVPVGLAHGHPVGVQLVASRFREDLALDAAAAVERHAGMLVQQLWDRETA